MNEDEVRTVRVEPFKTTDDVVWTGHDGKPRCAKHPYTCLVRASTLRSPFTAYPADAYICATCMREEYERRWSSDALVVGNETQK